MKKLFFILTALVALTLSIHATTVSVYLTNGHSLDGKLIYHDDTLLVVEPDVNLAKPIRFYPAKVLYFVISGIGRFDTVDDRFVPTEKALQKLAKQQQQEEEHTRQMRTLAANPNETIGRALRSTGSVAMAVGIPSLVAGTVLVAIGNSNPDVTKMDAAQAAKSAEARGKCAAAGYVLMPIGAALTIVGIPLYAHGKRIAQLDIRYTGNGAGVAINF